MINDKTKIIIDQNQRSSFNVLTVVDTYLGIKQSRGKSINTIKVYRSVLMNFFSTCTTELCDIIADDVFVWYSHYKVNKKPSTLIHRLSVLTGFFRYCIRKKLLKTMPIMRCWYPTLPDSLPRNLPRKELAAFKMASEGLNLRDRAILELLLSSGARRNEVRSLNHGDIDLIRLKAYVIGKGNKMITLHFSEACAVLLKKLMADNRMKNAPLFVNNRGRRLSSRWIYEITRKVGIMAKLRFNVSPHMLRHTRATLLLESTDDLGIVADILNHSNINTAKIYARLALQNKLSLYKRYMG